MFIFNNDGNNVTMFDSATVTTVGTEVMLRGDEKQTSGYSVKRY